MSKFEMTKIDGRWSVKLNDAEITSMIADAGVRIASREWPLPPAVEITLIPDEFRVDLDGADVAIAKAEVLA
jgi:hypothetical protein